MENTILKTESIKYIGSKKKILPYIDCLISNLKINIVIDCFAGSTRVSQFFKNKNYNVISNDISELSYVLNYCYLLIQKNKEYYQNIINKLNKINGFHGFMSQNYGGNENDNKKYWLLKNANKIDGIRQEIDNYNLEDKYVLLVSLILAADKVDSSLGHQTSYLKNWASRAYKDLKLEVPNYQINDKKYQIYKDDILELELNNEISGDLAYIDPPYGSNSKMPSSRVRYNSYYHIWKTLILNDNPQIFGRNNRRQDSRDKLSYNIFEDFRDKIALNALIKTINNINAKYILLSYNNNGIIKLNELLENLKFENKILSIDYKKNIMASMKWTNQWVNENDNKEYLILFKK